MPHHHDLNTTIGFRDPVHDAIVAYADPKECTSAPQLPAAPWTLFVSKATLPRDGVDAPVIPFAFAAIN